MLMTAEYGEWCTEPWCTAQVDGSVVVWDLHESSSLNESYTDSNGNEFQLRQPTYNTGNLQHSTLYR